MNIKSRKKKGFTIIELVIVMAVIVILSSFLIPKFSGYKNKAVRIKAIEAGRQIYTAAFSNSMDTDSISRDTISKLVEADVNSVSGDMETGTTINYTVNGKNYTLAVDDSSYSITEDGGEQIYPANASKENS